MVERYVDIVKAGGSIPPARTGLITLKYKRARSSVVERHSDKMEADGSIPSVPTKLLISFKFCII